MSHSTFNSPQNQGVAQPPRSNLFGLLQQRLIQHNDAVSSSSTHCDQKDVAVLNSNNHNIQVLTNQFEKTKLRRRMSHGDKVPTPYNSPAIAHHARPPHLRNACRLNQRLSGVVSPLHLSRDIGLSPVIPGTPPCTPENLNKVVSRSSSFPS